MSGMIKCIGFDEAIIGIAQIQGVYKVVYAKDKMIDILITRDKMSESEAVEFLEFNTWGSYVGESTPLYVEKLDSKQIDEIQDEFINM